MATLNRANRELYRRGPDETFATLKELHDHCRQERQYSTDVWQLPHTLQPQVADGELSLTLEKGETVGLNDWSFSQMCRLSGISKETINRFHPDTANVRDGLLEIRRQIEGLVAKRDARRDSFAEVLKKAMHTRLGSDAEEVAKELSKHDIPQHDIKDAMEIARAQGGFTIFALVDALTRLTQRLTFAADRAEADAKVARLLSLALAA